MRDKSCIIVHNFYTRLETGHYTGFTRTPVVNLTKLRSVVRSVIFMAARGIFTPLEKINHMKNLAE